MTVNNYSLTLLEKYGNLMRLFWCLNSRFIYLFSKKSNFFNRILECVTVVEKNLAVEYFFYN